MKRVLLSVFMLMGMLGMAGATTPTPVSKSHNKVLSDAKCKYKLSDAMSGLESFTVVGFVPRQESEDGMKVMGLVLYHDPKSADEKSVEAAALVMLDKRTPDKQLVLMVIYAGPKKTTMFKREGLGEKKELGPCFEKHVEDTQQEKP